MPRLSKKAKAEWAFFINPRTGKRQFNLLCQHCIHPCKQSYRAQIIVCPKYQVSKPHSKNGNEAL